MQQRLGWDWSLLCWDWERSPGLCRESLIDDKRGLNFFAWLWLANLGIFCDNSETGLLVDNLNSALSLKIRQGLLFSKKEFGDKSYGFEDSKNQLVIPSVWWQNTLSSSSMGMVDTNMDWLMLTERWRDRIPPRNGVKTGVGMEGGMSSKSNKRSKFYFGVGIGSDF